MRESPIGRFDEVASDLVARRDASAHAFGMGPVDATNRNKRLLRLCLVIIVFGEVHNAEISYRSLRRSRF